MNEKKNNTEKYKILIKNMYFIVGRLWGCRGVWLSWAYAVHVEQVTRV